MTADNRTNEPTEAQVEAAAKAIADCHNPGMFEKYPENWRVEARAALEASNAVVTKEAHDVGMDAVDWDMVRDGVGDPQEAASIAVRAALVAAQGAAPPVNSFGTSAERVKNGADSLHVEPQAESEYVYCPIHGDLLAARRSFVCEHAKKGHEYGTLVLPSSGVDEDVEQCQWEHYDRRTAQTIGRCLSDAVDGAFCFRHLGRLSRRVFYAVNVELQPLTYFAGEAAFREWGARADAWADRLVSAGKSPDPLPPHLKGTI